MQLRSDMLSRGLRTPRRLAGGLVVVAVTAALLFPGAAHAATILVTTTADQYGGGPAACSLREAIEAANTNAAFGGCPAGQPDGTATDVVRLQSGGPYTLTIVGAGEDSNETGDLDLNSTIEVRGVDGKSVVQAGPSEGAGIDRVFDGQPGPLGEVTLRSLVVRNGTTTGSGGGIQARGGALTVAGSTIKDNTSTSGPGGGGGGLWSSAVKTTITNSSVLSNSSTEGGGGILIDTFGNAGNLGHLSLTGSTVKGNQGVDGGGIYLSTGTASVRNTRISVNVAEAGGGIFDCSGVGSVSLRLTSVTFFNNGAVGGDAQGGGVATCASPPIKVKKSKFVANYAGTGGGLYMGTTGQSEITDTTLDTNQATFAGGGLHTAGPLAVEGTLFVKNTAGGQGGGVSVVGGSGGTIALTNSTFNGNEAGDHGGGLYNQFTASTIDYTTFSGNAAGVAPPGTGQGGGIFSSSSSTTTISGVILANSGSGGECSGEITSGGYNLVEDTNGCAFTPATGDITGEDPQLRRLADYGGRTRTRALEANSPALDAVDSDPECPEEDQRGYDRPGDGPDQDGVPKCDIGAFEDRPPHVTSVGLDLRRHLRAVGKMKVDDGFGPCRRRAKVRIQRMSGGNWETVGTDRTTSRGAYEEELADKTGTYRALVKQRVVTYKNADHFCHTALSGTRQHNH